MRIILLSTSRADFRWFRRYYETVFPSGRDSAKLQLHKARQALLAFPLIGHEVEGVAPMRELHISRTPFSLIYFINGEEIVITRLLDGRAERPRKLF